MPVLLVVVSYKALHPLLSFFDTVKAITGIQAIAAVPERVEEGLRIWDAVVDSRTAVREGNSVFLKQSYSGCDFHASALSECATSCLGLIPYFLKASPRKSTAK